MPKPSVAWHPHDDHPRHCLSLRAPTRNPWLAWHWIPGRARDDSYRARDDSYRARDDSYRARDDNYRVRDDSCRIRDDNFIGHT